MKNLQSVKENVQLLLNILFLCRNREDCETASEYILRRNRKCAAAIFLY